MPKTATAEILDAAVSLPLSTIAQMPRDNILPLRQPADLLAAVTPDAFSKYQLRLKAELGNDIYESWLARLELVEHKGTALHVSVPTRFLKTWLTTHYAARMLECWRSEFPTTRSIDISTRSPIARAPAKTEPAAEANRQLGAARGADKVPAAPREMIGSPLDAKYTLATYAVGRGNKIAHGSALMAMEVNPSVRPTFNPLFLHGVPGIGKTHLMQAIAHSDPARAIYVTAEFVMYQFLGNHKSQTSIDFKNALRSIPILLIDDIQFLNNKNSANDLPVTLSNVINSLIDSGSQVIVAADRPPSQLEGVDERLRSRLSGGLTVELQAPDEETRHGIIKLHLATMQKANPAFVISDEIIGYLAKTLTSNGRDLEGALNHLLAHSKLGGHAITPEMAQTAVEQLLQSQPARRIRIEEIQKVVARHYNITHADMISPRRTARVVRPRQVAVYLAKTLTLRSLPEIGRRFGGRDHTTVLHAVRKIEGLITGTTPEGCNLAADVEQIRRLLNA